MGSIDSIGFHKGSNHGELLGDDKIVPNFLLESLLDGENVIDGELEHFAKFFPSDCLGMHIEYMIER